MPYTYLIGRHMIPKEALFRKAEPFLLPTIVLLVGLTAFGLGRLSATPATEASRLVITMPPDSTQAAAPVSAAQSSTVGEASAPQGDYVASKSGTKYYLATCSGASRIKAENLVHFRSAQEAKAAGYEPAANCPGL